MTDVLLKFTGNVRKRLKTNQMDYDFDGDTLDTLLESLFEEYELRDLILDESGGIRSYSRVAINGRFSYLVGNMEAPIKEGDVITLIRPYVVAF
jgi:molybdopterin converting factor small subunit